MNKKLILAGAVGVAGFFVFSAFGGKTLEQQKAEIQQTITMKLDEIRAQKEQECTDKVNTEAQRRFDEIVAQRAAEAAKTPAKSTKGKGAKGPRVEPLPQPSKPTTTPSKDKWTPDGTTTTPSKEKWTPAKPDGTKPAPETPSKSKWTKPSGGGN